MATVDKAQIKDELIEALADDQMRSYFGGSGGQQDLTDLFKTGFRGFSNMSDRELIQCAADSGVGKDLADTLADLTRG